MTKTKRSEYVFDRSIDNSFYDIADLFYKLWCEMSKKLIAEGEKFGYRDSLERWINRVCSNKEDRIDSIKMMIAKLDYKSLEVSNRISHRYNEQFELYLTKCNNYESVMNLVEYWGDLPARFEGVLQKILDNMDVPDLVETNVHLDQTYSPPPKEGKFEYDVEEVGKPTSFFMEGLS